MNRGGTPGQSPGPTSKAEQAREITAHALDQLTQEIEAGNSESLDAFLNAMGRFHTYSFNNIMLLLAQKPDATRVAGFRTWKDLGRSVKKGEKGLMIFAPMKIKPKAEDGAADEDAEPQLLFRVVHVFDISQTEGEPLPEPERVGGDPGQYLDRLEAAVRADGIALSESDALGSADGVSKGGSITLRQGLSPAERFAVLAHEWAHELLHQRDKDERPGKTIRETEAEAVAYVTSRSIGLETGRACSDYIRMYAGDKETLAASLDRIQKAANRIIEAIHEDGSRSTREQNRRVHALSNERRQR